MLDVWEVRGLSVEARLLERRVIDGATGCWLWPGRTSDNGYVPLTVDGRSMSAHRLAYALWRGPLIAGLTIDHLCRVRNCFNPDHLEQVSQRENVLRSRGLAALNAVKTHCHRGHALDAENTRVRPNGQRVCRKCQRHHEANYRQRKQREAVSA